MSAGAGFSCTQSVIFSLGNFDFVTLVLVDSEQLANVVLWKTIVQVNDRRWYFASPEQTDHELDFCRKNINFGPNIPPFGHSWCIHQNNCI